MGFFRFIGSFLTTVGNHVKAVLLIVFIIWLFTPNEGTISEPYNLAVVSLSGEINDGREVLKELKDIYDDYSIKGVLFEIDSPGGAMTTSVEIAEMVKLVKSRKPVVSYASGSLASGSLYSALWSSKIIVNKASLVGSIGVIFDGINYRELADKIGIEPQVSKAGKFKEAGTGAREWLPFERAEIDRLTKESYKMFVSDVAEARNLDLNRSEEWAEARLFLGVEAVEIGLADEVGTRISAEDDLIALSGVHAPVFQKEDEFEAFVKSISSKFLGEFLYQFDYKLR
ncbi:signal peptide peptidase SppA, 36K type [Thiovulum sp. ES]|nr:signal peptide peptidase SppA, 36K type [Thiovulum sp. ES]